MTGSPIQKRRESFQDFISNRHYWFRRWNAYGFSNGEILVGILIVGGLIALGYVTYEDVSGTGKLASGLSFLMFVCVLRVSPLSYFFGVSYERAIRWHVFFFMTSLLFGCYHGLLSIRKTSPSTKDNVTGFALAGVMVLTGLMASRPMRRRFYQFFLHFHHLMSLAVVSVALSHGPGFIGFAGFCLVLVDAFYNLVYLPHIAYRSITSQVRCELLPCGVLRLSFKKGSFNFTAGQWVRICVPEVHPLEWHPFSLSSAPSDELVSMHIRCVGGWTQRLYCLARSKQNEGSCLRLFLSGAQGNLMVNPDDSRYRTFLLISGGIGVTPLQSILRHLIHEVREGKRTLHKIVFVWSIRNPGMLEAATEVRPGVTSRSIKELFEPDILSEISESTQEEGLTVQKEPGYVSLRLSLMKDVVVDLRYFVTSDVESIKEVRGAPDVAMGRPDIERIVRETATSAALRSETDIAVYTCGSQSLMGAVRDEVCKVNRGMQIPYCHLHMEHTQL